MLQKIHLEKDIKAPRQTVWDKIIGEDYYSVWTEAFGTSKMIGDWIEGETVRFIGGDTGDSGMISVIEKLSKPNFISIRHIGQVVKGVDDFDSEEAQKWIGAHENYTLEEKDGVTTFVLDMDMAEEYYEMMRSMWVRALGRLAILCEVDKINSITINNMIESSLEKVWDMWTNPNHITKWAFAADTWECPSAVNNLEVNGTFSTRMQEKANPENGFEFSGMYTRVEKYKLLRYVLDDGRFVNVEFEVIEGKVSITQRFDAEQENSFELQRSGWESMLENFKKYVESN